MDSYLVYVLLDSRKPGLFRYGDFEFNYEPFYVGMTKEKYGTARIKSHFCDAYKNRDKIEKDRNPYKSEKIRHIKFQTGNDPLSLKYKKGLTQDEARQWEKNLILNIGRSRKGPLTNLTNGGEGIYGYNRTLEEKQNLSLLKKGTHLSEETKNKISRSLKERNALIERHFNRGRKISNETKKKMSESHKGKSPSEETRKKQSQKLKNRVFSPEALIKMSLAKKGKKLSKETLIKMSLSRTGAKNPNYGKHRTEETKRKLFLANIGKHPSEETRKKMSDAHTGMRYKKYL